MMEPGLKTRLVVAVVGAGAMGHGIAQVIAQGGYPVTLTDSNPAVLRAAPGRIADNLALMVAHGMLSPEKAAAVLPRVRLVRTLEEAVAGADFVVESIVERLPLKQDLFRRLDALCPPPVILASNSSSFRITEIAAQVTHPERTVGSHFFMPAQLIPAVEVIRGEHTDDATVQRTRDLWQELGKTPVVVNKDIPGFLSTRLQMAIVREAESLLQKGVASAEDIDKIVRLSFGPRLANTGLLEQLDLAGLDIHLAVASYLSPDLEDTSQPLPIVVEKVQRGELGLKAGRGFFDWAGRDPAKVIAEKNDMLIRILQLVTRPAPQP